MDKNSETVLARAKHHTPVYPDEIGLTDSEFANAMEHLKTRGYVRGGFASDRPVVTEITRWGQNWYRETKSSFKDVRTT